MFGLGDPYEDASRGVDGPRPFADSVPVDSTAFDSASVSVLLYESFDQSLGGGSCATGGCMIATGGQHGGALALDGSGCVVFDLPATPATFTIAFWAKSASMDASTLLARTTEPLGTINVWKLQATDLELTFQMWNGTTETTLSAAHGLDSAAFHHYAVSYDGTNKTIFFDGQPVNVGPSNEPVYGNNMSVHLGCDERPSTDAFKGFIDELYIYDGALAPDQIGTLAM